MIKPTVHINGTSREELMEQYRDIGAAARELLAKISAAWPNGRDYYPQGDNAHGTAADEMSARRERIQTVLDEIIELHQHVADH